MAGLENQRIVIPYGHGGLPLKADFESWEVLEPGLYERGREGSQEDIVRRAMENPIGSPRLEELAKGKRTATILLSDHTRPVPSRVIIPLMVKALRQASPDIKITFLVATGCHRGTRSEELCEKLGDELACRETIVIHDCDDSRNMVSLGTLPSGAELRVNRLAVETELLLAEGFIEPHFFAGFSGGRKSVLPGVCARKTVMDNHCAGFIDSPYARTGNLENNPIHRDMAQACQMARLQYIVNVIIDRDKQVLHALAGHPIKAHEKGCEILRGICGVHPRQKGDVVITSNGGAPLDQNIYQVVKSLATAEAAASEAGVLVVCAECADGIGGDDFYRAMKDCRSPGELLERIRRVAPEDTVPDQWQYQILCRILEKHRVMFVTRPELKAVIEEMKMEYYESLGDAVTAAMEKASGNHVVVIPDGVSAMALEE